MERNNLLVVVDKLIKENYFHCEWGIEWREQRHYLELIFQFSLPNPNHFELIDIYGNQYNQNPVPFEVRAIIYDEELIKVEGKHYLKTVPVSRDTGIMYGELFALIRYLKVLTAEVPLKWTEYLANIPTTRFSIEWREDEFQKMRETLVNTSRYSESQVFFPQFN